MKNILRWFYIITLSLYTLGVIVNIGNNQGDIYQVWVLVAFIAGLYLIETKKKK